MLLVGLLISAWRGFILKTWSCVNLNVWLLAALFWRVSAVVMETAAVIPVLHCVLFILTLLFVICSEPVSSSPVWGTLQTCNQVTEKLGVICVRFVGIQNKITTSTQLLVNGTPCFYKPMPAQRPLLWEIFGLDWTNTALGYWAGLTGGPRWPTSELEFDRSLRGSSEFGPRQHHKLLSWAKFLISSWREEDKPEGTRAVF